MHIQRIEPATVENLATRLGFFGGAYTSLHSLIAIAYIHALTSGLAATLLALGHDIVCQKANL